MLGFVRAMTLRGGEGGVSLPIRALRGLSVVTTSRNGDLGTFVRDLLITGTGTIYIRISAGPDPDKSK